MSSAEWQQTSAEYQIVCEGGARQKFRYRRHGAAHAFPGADDPTDDVTAMKDDFWRQIREGFDAVA